MMNDDDEEQFSTLRSLASARIFSSPSRLSGVRHKLLSLGQLYVASVGLPCLMWAALVWYTSRQAKEAERLSCLIESSIDGTATSEQDLEEEHIEMADEQENPLVPPPIRRTLEQYPGAEAQCPNLHLSHFYDACDYTDPPDISESDKRLRLFKFSLTGRAKDWLDTIPPSTIQTWQQLERKFKDKYFPIQKFLERRADIMNFEQGGVETLYNSWERFKLCFKKCLDHGIDTLAQMQHFTQGLRPQTRMLLDASAGGSLKNKDENEAKELMETMAQNEYRAQNDRGIKKKACVLELDTQSAILAQMKLMSKEMEALKKANSNSSQAQANRFEEVQCDFCKGHYANGGCFPERSEQANYLANFRKNYPNNQNYCWGNNKGQGSNSNPPLRRPSHMEDTLTKFIQVTQENFGNKKASQETTQKHNEASIKNLETQMESEDREVEHILLGRPFLATGRTLIDVDMGELMLRTDGEEIMFNVIEAMKRHDEEPECVRVDVIEEVVEDVHVEEQPSPPLERVIVNSIEEVEEECEEEIELCVRQLEANHVDANPKFEEVLSETKEEVIQEENAKAPELKELPSHLKYLFLGDDGSNRRLSLALSLAWKKPSPTLCMHKIKLEDEYKPVVQPQRRLNPTMNEVVKKEVLKLLEARMIYPISDSEWVSPVHVVQKKGGMTVVKNEKNELIPTRTVTGWRMCIDYRRLNTTTRKDHFPLPFMDQILERFAGQEYYLKDVFYLYSRTVVLLHWLLAVFLQREFFRI
ncbi:hypothetical protein TSUD_278700 [Trifolium subterraneum]|uniref:Retrotransposon gag domain-containing protein n=1 Tax=Trifolium subterraneum TaxID=3900 RepID=A0A2Z6P0G9_TRISU|nr:hypothetical protein TSUD_278700 [Trifolium subterraneum]